MKQRLVIGLTGGIGSGKSTAANLFATLGVDVIDTDIISRELVEPTSPAYIHLRDHFGPEIFNQDASLNRQVLRQIIFDNPSERLWLETLLHPMIRKEIQYQINQSTSSYCIIVIPLLFETKQNELLNRILVVDCPEKLQLDRAMQRDNANKNEILKIIQSQVPRGYRLQHADDIITNNSDLVDLKSQVDSLHKQYLK